jgi:hypothetical protein
MKGDKHNVNIKYYSEILYKLFKFIIDISKILNIIYSSFNNVDKKTSLNFLIFLFLKFLNVLFM